MMTSRHAIALVFMAVSVATAFCTEEGDVDPRKKPGTSTDKETDGNADGDPPSSDGWDSGEAGSDGDADGDSDSDTDGDTDVNEDTGTGGTSVRSFIWIANSAAGTLSKVDTVTAKEVARYWTCPRQGACDPSRTSVNTHGDMVVTNRQPGKGPASVTKFAADKADCVDRNNNGEIETSTSKDEVLPWGEDECMLWNTAIGGANGSQTGARATAWDGTEDPDTGKGGQLFIGTTGYIPKGVSGHMAVSGPRKIFKLDGDDGALLASRDIPLGAYGGAVDGKQGGVFWYVAASCPMQMGGQCKLGMVNMDTLEATTINSPCGYGISIDTKGRIWTTGGKIGSDTGCIQRYSPQTGQFAKLAVSGYARGVAVDGSGSVWAAISGGDVVQVNEESVTQVKRFPVGQGLSKSPTSNSLVGVGIDYQGFVWAVSQGENAVHKIDPGTYEHIKVPVGMSPYTYSDMTGFQLKIAIGLVVK